MKTAEKIAKRPQSETYHEEQMKRGRGVSSEIYIEREKILRQEDGWAKDRSEHAIEKEARERVVTDIASELFKLTPKGAHLAEKAEHLERVGDQTELVKVGADIDVEVKKIAEKINPLPGAGTDFLKYYEVDPTGREVGRDQFANDLVYRLNDVQRELGIMPPAAQPVKTGV